MRESGQILARVLRSVSRLVQEGVSTRELDRHAREMIESAGARPAFLGYEGFPATLCVSLNEQVVHGIPSTTVVLRPGDLVSIDCGVYYRGFFSDSAVTVAVEPVSAEDHQLIEVTREALARAIQVACPGNRIGDIGEAVQTYVEGEGFSVVREYTGHGIGRNLHEAPKIPNFGRRGTGVRIQAGMVLALEPMVNAGTWRTRVLGDKWTVVTADGRKSCHFEHSVAVTEDGPVVLTQE